MSSTGLVVPILGKIRLHENGVCFLFIALYMQTAENTNMVVKQASTLMIITSVDGTLSVKLLDASGNCTSGTIIVGVLLTTSTGSDIATVLVFGIMVEISESFPLGVCASVIIDDASILFRLEIIVVTVVDAAISAGIVTLVWTDICMGGTCRRKSCCSATLPMITLDCATENASATKSTYIPR